MEPVYLGFTSELDRHLLPCEGEGLWGGAAISAIGPPSDLGPLWSSVGLLWNSLGFSGTLWGSLRPSRTLEDSLGLSLGVSGAL